MSADSTGSDSRTGTPSDQSVPFLPDCPTAEDSFGGHKALAQALATIVRKSECGLTIGLRGRWGSGKSSVILLLQDKLRCGSGQGSNVSAKNDTKVFVYDCWTDERDPLRRVFLERLLRALRDHAWLSDECVVHWEDRLSELAGRKTSTTTRNEYSPSWTGCYILLLLVIWTILNTLSLIWPHLPAATTLSWLISWLAGPLLVLLVVLLIMAICADLRSFKARSHDKKVRWQDRLKYLLTVAHRKGDDTTVSRTVTTPEPTAAEFEQCFCELMRQSLGRNDRRLVLVFDNLDRVDPKTAADLWSTLHSVVSSGEARADWRKRLFVVVPFDHTAIERIWTDESRRDRTDQGKEGEAEKVASVEKDEAAGARGADADSAKSGAAQQRRSAPKTLADAFAEKTFQIILDVPPPALAKYRGFLEQCLREGLPFLSGRNDEVARLYHVFRNFRPETWRAPTPREVKRYVNDVAALWLARQHIEGCETIPVATIGAFVLLRESLRDPHKDLLEGSNWRQQHDDVRRWTEDDHWLRHFAALALGVGPDDAAHILLYGPVTNALEEADGTRLTELLGHEGAKAVVADVLADYATDWAARATIGLVAHALSAADYGEDDGWRHLANASRQLGALEVTNDVVGRGLGEIIKWATELLPQAEAEAVTERIIGAVVDAAPGAHGA